MKSLAFCLCAFLTLPFSPPIQAAGTLSDDEAATLLFMREEEKMARDVYLQMNDLWQHQVFVNISESEQRHMEAMLKMIELYGLVDPVGNNPRGVFQDSVLTTRYSEFVSEGAWSLVDAFKVGAEVEEVDMIDLATAIEATDEDPLKRAYSNLLSASCNHLRAFVSHVVSVEGAYEPKYLDDVSYTDCVGEIEDSPVFNGAFSINPGLNDAWYYPGTNGQGFSITVYPGVKRLLLLWFTFDVLPPPAGAVAILGDPGQRWLVAEGTYEGSEAVLEIYSMSGGLFDDPNATPVPYFDGSIHLRFENCDSGIFDYAIPSLGLEGEIPIQRINSNNVARCLQESQTTDDTTTD